MFLTNMSALFITLIHLVHVLRGITGIIILNNVPNIYEIVVNAPLDNKAMRMSEISQTFIQYLKAKGLDYLETNKPKFTIYGILTGVCAVLDIILMLSLFWGLFFSTFVH